MHIGFLAFGTTMGQWLSLPMILFGAFLIFRAKRRS
jgi:prolipoprotein diacylglyceryltransferase